MAPARFSPFASLRHRNYRLFFIGQTTSLIGTWMQNLALGWLILELTNSAMWVGLVSALGALPVLLLSLPAGVFVDRSNKKRLVVIGQILFGVQAVLLTVLVATGVVRAWHVAVIATFVGAVNAIEIPARQALIVDLVGAEDLTNAIALNSSAFNATRVVGPMVAGLLIAHVSMAMCFAINALSYVAVIGALNAIRLPPFERPPRLVGNVEGIVEGLRFVRRDASVFALMANMTVLCVFGLPFMVLLPVFARDVLRVGPQGLGVMSACVGVGAMASAFGLAAAGPYVRRGRLVAWASVGFGAAVVGFAYAGSYSLALVILTVAGFAMILNNAATNTLLQALTPDALRGRVMSLWSLVFVGFGPLGALGLGALAERIGPNEAVGLGGVVCLLVSVAMWTWWAPGVAKIR